MAEKKSKGKTYSNAPKVQQIESNETYGHDLFTIVNHNGDFYVALGNSVVSKEKFTSREKAEHYVDCKPWELIFNSCAVLFDKLKTIEQPSNK